MKNTITRRQALLSLATITAGAFIKPSSIFGVRPAKNKIRFAVIGDWGTGDRDQLRVVEHMLTHHRRAPFDFTVAAGDNIYPNGSGRYFSKHFEQPFARLLQDRLNFYAVLGNHDVREGRQDQCQYPLFNMGGRCYYTLKQGDGLAEFFMLDSTAFDSAQAGWLENALRASTAKWKIAVFHHPIYSSGRTHGSDLGLRKKLEPLLTRYGVQLAFSGHDHIYERTKPQRGIQYFVSGAGGKIRRGDVDLRSPIREVSFDEEQHFMLIEIEDQQISHQAISESGTVIDSGIIKQA